ncbi:hypothetical protein BGZ83_003980 [Gryganskiella cystojenkinii]|nr:hypothetical protein BGZ83_003980 [Gryganskiella cystojenkinii]
MFSSTASSYLPPRLLSRQEPLLFCNFDLNPNTSVFGQTFVAATLFQITGFYLFRHFVPELAVRKRRLSWVLTFFSSLVLFTGTFTLSSNMEWTRGHDPPLPVEGHGEHRHEGWQPLLSMRAFPLESSVATMYSAYFVSYLICDLILGMIHYRAYIDPLSGWCHHLGYLAVVSNATLQNNVSTLFAMGTPIEVSTIFLASGHIFPQLRSDFLFATSFFLGRIIYPVVLLPELFLNVDSRFCWKVGLMALMVHVHWFKKFVEQQIRYYRARHSAPTTLNASTTTKTVQQDEKEGSRTQISTKIANDQRVSTLSKKTTPEQQQLQVRPSKIPGIVIEYATKENKKDTLKVVEIMRNNAMAEIPEEVQTLQGNDEDTTKLVQVLTSRKSVTRPSLPEILLVDVVNNRHDSQEVSSPSTTKTMEQLLKECAGDEEEFVRHWPISSRSNKTFSAVAMKRLMSSQGKGNLDSNGAVALGGPESRTTGGVLQGISRASSMRDSRRRISLDAVRFEEPVVVKVKERTVDEALTLRSRRPKSSLLNEDKAKAAIQIANHDIEYNETIRVSRRGIVAVNA